MVTVDSLRTDHCGFMNPSCDLTPTLDGLADDGLIFENAVAHGTATRGSAASFITGQYPIDRPTADDSVERIRQHVSSADTLPERLSREGYTTAAFTANPWTSRHFFERDVFDHFEDFLDEDASSDHLMMAKEGNNKLLTAGMHAVNWWQGQNMFMSWESVYDDIEAWIEDAEEPYFLWVFLVDVHMPFLPPAEFRTQSLLRDYLANAWLFAEIDTPLDGRIARTLETAYANCVRYTDAFFDRLEDTLAADPLLVVHADHGEVLNDDGEGKIKHGNTREEVVHVPMFIANGPSGRVRDPVSLKDLLEIVYDLAVEGEQRDWTRPYVTTRTFHGKYVLRGRDWRFASLPDGEHLERVGGDDTSLPPGLADIGRAVIDRWKKSEAERRSLIGASAELASRDRF